MIFEEIFTEEKFDYLNNLNRWNGLIRIKEETVAHHSFVVGWFNTLLAEEVYPEDAYKQKYELVTYGGHHDFDEIFTGDITHDVKYNQHMGVALRALLDDYINRRAESEFLNQPSKSHRFMGKMLKSDVSKLNKDLTKISDWLSMYFYLKKEMKLGNVGMVETLKYCVENIKSKCHQTLDSKELLHQGYNSRILKELITLDYLKYAGARE